MNEILSEEKLVHLLNEAQIEPINMVANAMLQAVYDSHEESRKRLKEAEEIIEEVAQHGCFLRWSEDESRLSDKCISRFCGNAIEYKEKYKEEK